MDGFTNRGVTDAAFWGDKIKGLIYLNSQDL